MAQRPINMPLPGKGILPYGLFFSQKQKDAMPALAQRLSQIATEFAMILHLEYPVRVVFDEDVTLESRGRAAGMYTGLEKGYHVVRLAPETLMPDRQQYIMSSLSHEIIHAWQNERDFDNDNKLMQAFAIQVNSTRGYEHNPFEKEAYAKMYALAEARQVVRSISQQALMLTKQRWGLLTRQLVWRPQPPSFLRRHAWHIIGLACASVSGAAALALSPF